MVMRRWGLAGEVLYAHFASRGVRLFGREKIFFILVVDVFLRKSWPCILLIYLFVFTVNDVVYWSARLGNLPMKELFVCLAYSFLSLLLFSRASI